MSGRVGGLNLGAELEKSYGTGEEEPRRVNEDNGERRGYSSRFDGERRGDSYRRFDSDRGYNDRYRSGHSRGSYDRRDGYYRDDYRRNDRRGDHRHSDGSRFSEPVKTKADFDDNWRNKSAAPVVAEESNESGAPQGRFADRFKNPEYRDRRDFHDRDRRGYRDDRRGYRDDRRDYRDDRRDYRDDRRDYRDDRRDYRDDRRDYRDDRRDYRDDRRDYRDDRRDYRDDRRGYRDDRREYRDDRRDYRRREEQIAEKPKSIASENPFNALQVESEEEDTSNMSIPELKERAARMNREREEQSAKDLEKRDSLIREKAEAKSAAQKEEKAIRLNVNWTVELPKKYSAITLPQLSDNKLTAISTAIQDFMKKSNASIIRCLSDFKNTEVPFVLYRVLSLVLRKGTPENRYIPMACAMLNNAKDVITPADIDDVLQRCFLDASSFDAAQDVLEKNFSDLTSQLYDYKLIEHLPTYEAVEEEAQPVQEEAQPVEEVQAPTAASGVKESDREAFVGVLGSNLMGDELADKVKELQLPQNPEFMYILLDFIIGNNDVAEFIKTKNDISLFVPFRVSNYGSLIYSFFDECDLSVHIALLNQIVKFWDDKQLPSTFLEAAFYTAFDNDLVYGECLDEWKDQSNRTEVLDRAVVKLNNTMFQIQDLLINRE